MDTQQLWDFYKQLKSLDVLTEKSGDLSDSLAKDLLKLSIENRKDVIGTMIQQADKTDEYVDTQESPQAMSDPSSWDDI